MPTVLTIRAAEPHFVLKWLAAGSTREPLCVVSLEIVWVSSSMPAGFGNLFWSHPAVLDKPAVHVRICAVRSGAPDDRWNRVDDVAKLRFLCSDCFFCNLAFRDVDDCSYDFVVAGFVTHSMRTVMKVLDRTVRH